MYDTGDIISWHRLLRRNHFIVLFSGRLFRPGWAPVSAAGGRDINKNP